MSREGSAQDPLDFVRGMWNSMGFSLPGMVTPTLDVEELDKRIADLKAVEHWLQMNLNMLQMTTQGLEIQRAALAAVKAMSAQASEWAADRTPERAPERTPEPPPERAGEPTPEQSPEATTGPAENDEASAENPFAAAAMWPWNLIKAQMAAEAQAAQVKPAGARARASSTFGKASTGKTTVGKASTGKTTAGKTSTSKTTARKRSPTKATASKPDAGAPVAAKTRTKTAPRKASAGRK